MKIVPLLIAGVLLSGCAGHATPPGEPPALSPVGSGAVAAIDPAQTTSTGGGQGSLWRDSAVSLYRDRRAVAVGDIVTVLIDVDDQAALRSSSSRNRTSGAGYSLKSEAEILGIGGEGEAKFNGTGQTSSTGQGTVQRSERVSLSVAATVTVALPNGNLAIAGLQEMRINNEMRVLGVQGVVRLKDISPDNTVQYDQMAEARVTYGGAGRIAEIQQPTLLHQIYDRLAPM
jgi:flagellar L-ring protein FlgH